ncbi:unnamed protein product [Linum trigynum]|uniref:Uncharacterized protein n=1 Tax=Linum trigynum TaxID=586398 RepID=A0AAV2CEU9_9ROSI
MEDLGSCEKEGGVEPQERGTEGAKEVEEHDGRVASRVKESTQTEGAQLTKEELLHIIESQDHALEILKK